MIGEVTSVKTKTIVFFIATIFELLGNQCSGLHLTNMSAPVLQDPRKEMPLHCRFDMAGEDLYAVKWYKDDHEFFRYSPSVASSNKIQQFTVRGVTVDSRRSKCTSEGCDLLLTQLVRPHSSGAYRCEVSSEAPTFRLASQTHNITVAAIPDQPPKIENLMDTYVLDDLIVAQCISGFGDPKPTITWFINKQPITSKLTARELIPLNESPNPLKSTTVQLKYHVEKKLPQNKARITIEITCVSHTEGISPIIAPPMNTTRIINIIDQNQIVNNQKLLSSFSGGGKTLSGLGVVLVGLVLWC